MLKTDGAPNPIHHRTNRDWPHIPERRNCAIRPVFWEETNFLLRVEQQKKLQVWKDRVGTFSGACRWMRQEDAKPYVVQNPEGQVMTSRVTALNALNGFWDNIFGAPDQAISTENFFQVFQHDLPNRRECEKLPKIQCSDVKRMAMEMRKKSHWN